jgi:hypothetical protein
MLSFGGVDLHIPGPEVAAFVESRIPIDSAFGFFRPKFFGDVFLDPRQVFAWHLSRPFRLYALSNPWGVSRFGYCFALADAGMLCAITAQNGAGNSLSYILDDGVGASIGTQLYMLAPVPLSKILVSLSLPLWLLPLVDERYRLYERAATITVTEGETTWADLYAQLASAAGIALTVDPINPAYLWPSAGFSTNAQHLPLLLDLCAASCGQRIVRNLDGTYNAYNPATAFALMVAQANAARKYAGGSLNLAGVIA